MSKLEQREDRKRKEEKKKEIEEREGIRIQDIGIGNI